MGFVPGPLEAAGQGGTGAGGTDDRAKSGPIQPRGSQRRQCLYRLSCVQRGSSHHQRCAGCRRRDPCRQGVVPADGWLGTKRSSGSTPSGAAAPRPTAERLVSQVRQSLQRSHTHLLFLVLAAVLVVRFLRTKGPEMLRLMSAPP